ncbi:MAG: MFS transporter [Eubacterium sp.]
MLTTLLLVILMSYIGIGLPDSVFGTSWPAMYSELNLPISLAGYITSTINIGTIISSVLSSKVINKFGTGLVTAVSTGLTAVALLGFGFAKNPVFLFLLSIPLGLGAGAIDTALNSFVALHYDASKVSFLHCFYGVGVASSPFILSLVLGEEGNWRRGYIVISVLLIFITLINFISLPIWKKVQKNDAQNAETVHKTLSLKETVAIPGVLYSCFVFFASCALELTTGYWCSTYFVTTKGMRVDEAAKITMLYYIGLAGGRFISGLLSKKLSSKTIIKISFGLLFVFIFILLFDLPLYVSMLSLFFIGMGIGPVFPNLVHLTPYNFGENVVESVMGIQQAVSYVGVMIMPWLFGVLAQRFSTSVLPLYLMALLILYFVFYILLIKTLKKRA